jgi:hypothetical protein
VHKKKVETFRHNYPYLPYSTKQGNELVEDEGFHHGLEEGKSLDILKNIPHNCKKLGRLNGRALDGRV